MLAAPWEVRQQAAKPNSSGRSCRNGSPLSIDSEHRREPFREIGARKGRPAGHESVGSRADQAVAQGIATVTHRSVRDSSGLKLVKSAKSLPFAFRPLEPPLSFLSVSWRSSQPFRELGERVGRIERLLNRAIASTLPDPSAYAGWKRRLRWLTLFSHVVCAALARHAPHREMRQTRSWSRVAQGCAR